MSQQHGEAETATARFEVRWAVRGGKARSPSNPAYPTGVDLVTAVPSEPSCKVVLPYPAECVGSHLLRCRICGTTVVVSAAGRPDDPRSVTVSCRNLVRA